MTLFTVKLDLGWAGNKGGHTEHMGKVGFMAAQLIELSVRQAPSAAAAEGMDIFRFSVRAFILTLIFLFIFLHAFMLIPCVLVISECLICLLAL